MATLDPVLPQLEEDLEDLPHQLNRYEQARRAEEMVIRLVQVHGRKVMEPCLSVVTDWWDKIHPPHAGETGQASHHTLMSVICAVRAFGEMGS